MLQHENFYAAPCRPRERGAALITVVLISLLLLAAGGAFIAVAARSVKNAYGSTPETQAYYAAEAGAQAALNVMRGQVQPAPLFDTSSAAAAANKVTLRQMESIPTLSRWLTYNNTFSPPRVTLTSGYTQQSGMAYSVSATDPDNTRTVTFSVEGYFPDNGNSLSLPFGNDNNNKVTITYAPPTNPATVDLTGSKPFGTLQFTPTKPVFTSNTIADFYPQGINFNLKITQTSPYPATSAAPLILTLKCKITGVISTTAAQNTVTLAFPNLSNNLGGVSYVRAATTQALSYTATNSITPPTVTAPDPYRLVLKVTGYGPSYAEKHLQLMVSRLAFDFKANAAVTLRGSDSGGAMGFSVGDSAQYSYTGDDKAGGPGLPAFVVTNGSDYTTTSGVLSGSGSQVTGTSQVQQISPTDLSSFLRDADGARALVSALRESAQGDYWPVDSTGPANDRYFPAGTTPNTYGADVPKGLFTFVDGDAALPPAGGAGWLVVTGTLDMRGAADFKGVIMVLGKGEVLRDGGGNGTTLGSIVVAKFGDTGGFLAPTFSTSGGGASAVQYDSKWVETALMRLGPRVVGVSEY